jgi:predicted outer membrane protein
MQPASAAVTAQLEWEPPLRYRRGARKRLRGIALFYDFPWNRYFPDRRAQFVNGQSLAGQVIEDCPPGLRPALLLSDRGDVEEGGRTTDDYYVVVVDFPRYLKSAEGNAAAAYLAQRLGPGITRAKSFSEVAQASSEELADWLGDALDADVLKHWIDGNTQRVELLRAVAEQAADPDEGASTTTDVARALAALETLQVLDAEVAQAITELVTPETDPAARLELLRALTGDVDGRYATSEVLQERAHDRLADARAAADEFEELLRSSGETALHEFLELNPWLLGLDYAQVRPRQQVPRGAVDFLLERFDGFHDLLELKSPDDAIFELHGRAEIPSPSSYRLSRALSLALAQVHAYRDILRHEEVTEELFGLPHTREPRITILIGQISEATEAEARLLKELNRSLHRVEVVPFDVLARRARAVLNNVERYLLAADEASDASAP